MVQKSKGGNKKRSVVAGKKAKNMMKHNRKTNYKKKVVKKVECCVCMEEIPNTSDNTITCGKVNHALCGECKMKCDDCPMCRSHKVQKPISQSMGIRVIHRGYTKFPSREKIIVKGLVVENIDLGNGIYEKQNEDGEGYGIYKHEYRDLYIYRDFDNIWILDDRYNPCDNYVYAEGKGKNKKLFGKNIWFLSGSDDWVPSTIRIKKLK
tara:strand:+ start:98 stop:721 length:624 start_codon:yes stop_codon:yes gene_type:complete